MEPGARKLGCGSWKFGFWYEGEFRHTAKVLPDRSALKKYYFNTSLGKKRNMFNKGWFVDVMQSGEYPTALIEGNDGQQQRFAPQAAIAHIGAAPGAYSQQSKGKEPQLACQGQAADGRKRQSLNDSQWSRPLKGSRSSQDASGSSSRASEAPGNINVFSSQEPLSAPANSVKKPRLVDRSRQVAVGIDLGSTYTRASYSFDNSFAKIPLEEEDQNHDQKETAIYVNPDLEAWIGQKAITEHEYDWDKAKDDQDDNPPVLYKNWKRYIAYSWPGGKGGPIEPPRGFSIGDDTQLQVDIASRSGGSLSLPLNVLIMFHIHTTLARIIQVLDQRGFKGIKKLGIAVPGRYNTPQKETLRRAFHAAACHQGMDLPLEDICCFCEASASMVGFLRSTAHTFCSSFSGDVLDSGGSSTHIQRVHVQDYNGCQSRFFLEELSSRTVMCGGYDLNFDMMEVVCNKLNITDFASFVQNNPYEYYLLYDKVEKAKKAFKINVTNQEFAKVLNKEECKKMKAKLRFRMQDVEVSVRDLRPENRKTRSQTPIFNMIKQHNSQFSTKIPNFVVMSGGNAKTHLLHLPVNQAHISARNRYSAEDPCCIANGAAILAGGLVNFKPLHGNGFGYVFQNEKGKEQFYSLEGKTFSGNFHLLKGTETVIWKLYETIPELPEHHNVAEHSIINAPENETLLPVLCATITRRAGDMLQRKAVFKSQGWFNDQTGLPDIEVSTTDLMLDCKIEKLWENINFAETLRTLEQLKWVSCP